MKIGFDAKRLFFNASGLGVYSRSTVGILHRYAPQNKYALFTPKEGNRCGSTVPEDIEIIAPHGLAASFGSLWRSYLMGKDIKRSGVDIYHGLSAELPSDIRRSGARSVVTIHDLIFVHHPELYKPADRYLYTKKYGRSCHDADRIISISRQTRRDLIDYWNIPEEKIDVVYQGCSPIFESRVSPEEKRIVAEKYAVPEKFILSVGSIEPRKNLMLTVKAMAEQGKEWGLPLVACGKHTPYADEVMDFAVRSGIGDRIRMIHNVSFGDLPALYQMADVFVYPSFYEGFGIPILEALNSGTPVITTEGGVFPETGGDACIYIDPGSSEQMAIAINSVMDNDSLRRSMTEKGYEHAKKFREPIIAQNLMAVYNSVL